MKDMDIKLLFDICSLLYLQGRAIIHTFFNPKGNVIFRFWKKGEESVCIFQMEILGGQYNIGSAKGRGRLMSLSKCVTRQKLYRNLG